jgi:hypothetical protein
MPDTLPEPWFSFLNELDGLVNAPLHSHCIRGFVVTMLYGLGRTPADVDVFHITPRSAEDAFAHVAMKGGNALKVPSLPRLCHRSGAPLRL